MLVRVPLQLVVVGVVMVSVIVEVMLLLLLLLEGPVVGKPVRRAVMVVVVEALVGKRIGVMVELLVLVTGHLLRVAHLKGLMMTHRHRLLLAEALE